MAKGNYGVTSLGGSGGSGAGGNSSGKPGANRKPMRGQIEPIMKIETMGDVWSLTEDDLRVINENATREIQQETGMSYSDAEEARKAMVDYLGGDFEAYRTGSKQDYIDTIDRTLSKMSAYEGEIYRGLHFVNTIQYNAFMAGIQSTGEYSDGGSVGSWSSSYHAAMRFSNYYDESHSIVFVCTNNTAAVGIQHISKFGKAESEVLAPSGVRWVIQDISTTVSADGYYKTIIEVSQESYSYKSKK